MLGQLVPCGGGPPIPLLKPKLVIGRDNTCDVTLRSVLISARHCELTLRDGYWFVHDLGSRNGTRINGALCLEQWLLPNEVLAVAAFAFIASYTPPADRRVPERVATKKTFAGPAPSPKAPVAPTIDPGGLLGELLPCGGGDPIPLRKAKLVVGRRPDCDIAIPINVVSGRHCELELQDGFWHVRDLGSRHGTRVDGVQCQTKVLMPGSILWIANQRYKIAYKAPGDAPAAASRSMFARSLLEAAGLARWEPPEPKRKLRDDDPHRERYALDE
jgi:adenylate cyclase